MCEQCDKINEEQEKKALMRRVKKKLKGKTEKDIRPFGLLGGKPRYGRSNY